MVFVKDYTNRIQNVSRWMAAYKGLLPYTQYLRSLNTDANVQQFSSVRIDYTRQVVTFETK